MSDHALTLENVGKRFGSVEIIRDLNFHIPTGERWAVVGPNGAGKSLLINMVSGFSPLSAGTIRLFGQRIDGLAPHAISRMGLSRSFQVTNVFARLSVHENLQCAVLWSLGYRHCFWRSLAKLKDVHRRVEELLDQIGLCSRRATLAGELSYAEQRALELGIAVAGAAQVLLLDEPTAGMSRPEANAAVALIRSVTAGKTLLMVEHDMDVVFDLADGVIVLGQGTIIACDTPSAIRANPAVREAYLGSTALPEI